MKNELEIGDGSGQNPARGYDPENKDEDKRGSLTDWKIEPSVLDLKNDLQACQSSHDSQVYKVKKWLDLRDVKNGAAPKKRKGRSSVQPKLIRRQAEWRYSALSEPFLSTSKLYNMEPVTWEDENSARQNELVINWQFRTKINKVKFIDEYVRTAVDEGTVIVRVGWDRETKTVKKMVPVWVFTQIINQEEAGPLKEALDLVNENPRAMKDLPEAMQMAVEAMQEEGIPYLVQQEVDEAGEPVFEEVEEVEVLKNEPTLEIIDSENIYIDSSAQGDIKKAKFVIYSYETTKAALKKDGRYKNLDKVNWSGNRVLSQPDHATNTPDDFQLQDELRAPIVVYEYWGLYDIDGEDELTPIVATWIGDTMIRMEENPFPDKKPPFVIVPYLPVKKSMFGEPDAEILEDNQAVLGAVMRGMIDLMGRSAMSQTGTAKGFLDVTNRRRFNEGEDYEYNPGNGDPRLSIYQHTYPEIPNSAMTMLQLQNQEAEAISGVKAFSGGLSAETYGDVAAGIKGMLDASAKREMNILRRLAKGVIDIGVKISAMNAVFMSEEETIRVTNEKYVTVRREELEGNFDIKVDINTAEIDESKARDLGFMLQTMGPDMDPAMSRKILAEIAELKRMPTLAQDLRTYQPQPDPVEEKKKELEVAKLEAEIAKLQSEAAENMAQAAKYKADADLSELEFVEQETGTNHARQKDLQRAQSQGNQDLEVTKALVNNTKPGEASGDVAAAIGYNRMTD